MSLRPFTWFLITGLFLLTSPPAAISASATVDHSIYADLLSKHVRHGLVDYAGFLNERERLNDYLKVLEKTSTGGLDRDEQLAFYINAYNAWTIWLVLTKYPGIESIKDLGSVFSSPWKKKICRIDGRLLSLDDIEHGIIRPRFQDARIHFAVNCASMGCPPLLEQPYEGRSIDAQLERVTREFVNNRERNRIEVKTLYLSRIFQWYGEDFKPGVAAFIGRYADEDFRKKLAEALPDLEIRYLDYDWKLNAGSAS